MRKLLGLFFFSIMFLTLVSAVPPVTTTQDFSEGFAIEIPQDNILRINEAYTFNFHLFNISNGVHIYDGVSCYFHLYGRNGMILADLQSSTSDDGGYKFTIDNKNLTDGNVYYFVHCNDSALGGYSESIIIVTPEGDAIPDGAVIVFFSLLSLVVFFFLLYALLNILQDFSKLEVDLKTVALGFAAYMSNLALYYYLTQFISLDLMLEISYIGISAFGITHLFLPLVGLIFSWLKKGGVE